MSGDAIRGMLAAAGLPAGQVVRCERLPGGTYNSVHRITAADGRELVLKVPPPATAPCLRYERGILRGEAVFHRAAADAGGVPVPEVVHEDRGGAGAGPFLLMSACPGTPWDAVAETLEDGERSRLRGELGRLVARLHTVTGPAFGYPAESVAPLAPAWRPAFTAMLDAVLDDAVRYGVRLPRPAALIRRRVHAASPVLEEVTVPALVHFDLWQGNVLLTGAPGARTIGGIIDGERMFWGDPLADFASSALFGDIEDDPAFLAGYASGGGRTGFDAAARTRMALYRCYLYLIMLVEVEPRRYPAGHRAWVRRHVTPHLEAALDALGPAPSGPARA
ncbi:phosphotransferase family protein [Streptomyces sp. DH37]|uniref:phosphotransferase family protein n=1 Tax=Streptomyces sp. DH37 TaxID=3040122 RepID=UPI0024417F4E|nr:aminoglycoside phosphotransferase family protein [Streptomyces sp. DH37]MDG9703225.1 aminoglycoside phosphotransferase family protein [Streptomyces sp. DH37]